MARIRKVEIRNFRSIANLDWFPGTGINCLIGPGDSGKSTILDAIDYCLGARRTLNFCDDDFHGLNSWSPIRICITLGELDGNLQSLETYGPYLRGFHLSSGAIEPEPGRDLDTVLTVELQVSDDLEPQWRLISERADAQGISRGLSWADRVRLAPTRLGQSGAFLTPELTSAFALVRLYRFPAFLGLANAIAPASSPFWSRAL